MANITWIGLGVMGYPMAGHLVTKGNHHVNVYNRSEARAISWVNEFASNDHSKRHATPKNAAQNADIVCCCVGNDNDVEDVLLGEHGAIHSMKKGSFLIDHTTASADIARKLNEECKKRDIIFIDAPVSGGQAGAENGVLAVMCGCDDSTKFDEAASIMAAYGKNVKLMGQAGNGQLTKMVNQICIAGVIQGLSEALAFAKKSNLDTEKLLEIISGGAAQSWQMVNRGHTMVAGEFDFGFAVDWMRKDLSICLHEAKNNGALLPVTALIDQFYSHVQNNGGGRFDTSSLITLLDDNT